MPKIRSIIDVNGTSYLCLYRIMNSDLFKDKLIQITDHIREEKKRGNKDAVQYYLKKYKYVIQRIKGQDEANKKLCIYK